MTRPPPSQIDLWCLFCDRVNQASLLARYRQLLSHAERRQETRFHFQRDRHCFVLTRALVRTTLSRYAPVKPEDWQFTANLLGRPEIVNGDGRSLSFNITHTHQLIVLAVAHQRCLGVDTEDTAQRRAALSIADRYFTPEEAQALRALPPAEQSFAFCRYWTLKESYIKARGLGLTLPLRHFGFRLTDPRAIRMTTGPELADEVDQWQFWQWSIQSDQLLALCAQRLAAPSRIALRHVIPLQSEEPLPCREVGRSE